MYISHERDPLEFNAKIVIVGEPGVGKTSLRRRYIGKGFKRSHIPTLGADFAVSKYDSQDGRKLITNIWDLAGQKSYRKIIKHYLKNIDGVILVYDLSSENSLLKLKDWMDEIWKSIMWPVNQVPMILIGNKSDLVEGDPKSSEVLTLLEMWKHPSNSEFKIDFIVTSALNGTNVPLAFENLNEKILTFLANFQNKSKRL